MIFWNPVSRHPVLVHRELALVSSNHSILRTCGVVNGKLAFRFTSSFAPSALCSVSQPPGKSWPMGGAWKTGQWEKGRGQGVATPLSASGGISCSGCLLSLAPSPRGQLLLLFSHLRGQLCQGSSTYWMPRLPALPNYLLLLSLQPQEIGSSLLLPLSYFAISCGLLSPPSSG